MDQKTRCRLAAIAIGPAAALVLQAAAAGAQAEPPQIGAAALAPRTTSIGNVRVKHTARGELAHEGELVVCTVGEFVVETRLTYIEFAGVCSDEDGPSCAGRLISLTETCIANPTSPGQSGNAQSATRICYDPSGSSACTEQEQVALTANTSTSVISSGAGGTLRNRTEIRDARIFEMNGR
ncbi:MAG: hypothetical protein V3U43_01775, partial [Pseudomonadales bacterium]